MSCGEWVAGRKRKLRGGRWGRSCPCPRHEVLVVWPRWPPWRRWREVAGFQPCLDRGILGARAMQDSTMVLRYSVCMSGWTVVSYKTPGEELRFFFLSFFFPREKDRKELGIRSPPLCARPSRSGLLTCSFQSGPETRVLCWNPSLRSFGVHAPGTCSAGIHLSFLTPSPFVLSSGCHPT